MSIILDHEEDQLESNQRSKKSFWYFVWAVIIVLTLMLLTYLNHGRQPSENVDLAFGILGLILIVIGILGFKNGIQSLITKEKWSVYKIVGLVGNLIMFGAILILIVSNALDVQSWYNGN